MSLAFCVVVPFKLNIEHVYVYLVVKGAADIIRLGG